MPQLNRREFLWLGMIGFLVAVGGYLAAAARFLFPNVLYEPPSRFKIGSPDQYPPGSATYLEEKRFFVFHDPQGLYAISSVCTHLSCNVRWVVAGGFACPCHGSVFDKNGKVLKGPAPRPLEWYRLSLTQTNEIIIDAQDQVGIDFRLKV